MKTSKKLPKFYAVASDGAVVRIANCNLARRWVVLKGYTERDVQAEREARVENARRYIANVRRQELPEDHWLLRRAAELEAKLPELERIATKGDAKGEWRVFSRHTHLAHAKICRAWISHRACVAKIELRDGDK